MRLIYIILYLLVLLSTEVMGQDVQFSQFYAVPTHLNPAFAGSAHRPRAILHQRVQWPRLDAKYLTSLVSGDTYFEKYNSGFGIYVMQDMQGANEISTSEAHLQYSYEIALDNTYTLRTGVQLGYVSRFLNYANLRFPDQYTDSGFANDAVSSDRFFDDRKGYMDAGTGAMLYSDNIWVGISAHHFNRPNQSFLGEVSRLPAKFAMVAGYKFIINEKTYSSSQDHVKEFSIMPTIHYKFQGKSDQFDMGLYAIYDKMIAGVWYRGIPFKKYMPTLHNNESMVFTLGYKLDNVSVAYSYDYTVSKLSTARTGGAHELNITYLHYRKKKGTKIQKRIPCPDFK